MDNSKCLDCGDVHPGDCSPNTFQYYKCSNCDALQKLPWDVPISGGPNLICRCNILAVGVWERISYEIYQEESRVNISPKNFITSKGEIESLINNVNTRMPDAHKLEDCTSIQLFINVEDIPEVVDNPRIFSAIQEYYKSVGWDTVEPYLGSHNSPAKNLLLTAYMENILNE